MPSACPACLSPRSRPSHTVREYAFRRCSACRTLFIADRPDPAELEALYADERYFANPDFGQPERDGYHGYLDYLSDREHIEAKFARVLERLERLRAPGRLLDVGAGPGFMVAAANARGWQAQGVDLNPWAVAHARETVGVDVTLGRLEALIKGPGPLISFDALTLMDLVEHVPDVDALLAAACAALAPGGAIAVLTPDAGSPVSRALGKRWPEVERAPEHLVLFSRRGLAAALARHGFAHADVHSIGKESSVGTLIADVLPTAPALIRPVQALAERTGLAKRTVDFDPRTKFVLYATAR